MQDSTLIPIMKNILILSQYAGTPEYGMVLRNHMLAREWVKQGHRVTIVGSKYSHYRNYQPSEKKENIDGIDYWWLYGNKYSGNSAIGRILSMFIFTIQCLFLNRKFDKLDLIICSSPHPFTIYPGHALAKLKDAYLIYDIRDLWPLTPKLLGNYSERHPFIRMLQAAENFACKKSDLVIAVQSESKDYLVSKGLERRRFLPVHNGVSSDIAKRDDINEKIKKKLLAIKERNGVIIGYTGALGRANAMDVLINALIYLPNNIHLVIVGSGPYKNELIAQSRKFDGQVHFIEPIRKSEIAAFLEYVDIAYVGGHNSPLYKYGASLTKVNDYMSAGKPILYGLNDPNNAVTMSGAGKTYKPGCSEDLAKKLLELIDCKESLKSIGKKGQEWVYKNRNLKKSAEEILLKLTTLGKRSRTNK